MEPTYKYLVLFPIPEPESSDLCALMNDVAEYTKLPPPYKNIPPHVTFHRPISKINPETLVNLVRSASLQSNKTRITVSSFLPFEKQYIVLPVHETLSFNSLWVELYKLLSCLPQYEHGEFDPDNTLHITVARKVSNVFYNVWPKVRLIPVPILTISVTHIELYRKQLNKEGAVWERIESFPIPDYRE